MEGTCATERSPAIGGREIMLFGVRVVVDSMRKCVSLNDLSQYGEPHDLLPRKKKKKKKMEKDEIGGIVYEKSEAKEDIVAAGYASADDAVRCSSGGNRVRKRGIPWTEEEHKLFLIGLLKVGKGDWRGISRNFVKTRTPTQVASHAQKYYLRHNNLNSNRHRRRSSLFDIPTDLVIENPVQNPTTAQTTNQAIPVCSIPEASQSATISDLKLSSKPAMDRSQVSLNLSLSPNQKFQVVTDFSCSDNNSSIIRVA